MHPIPAAPLLPAPDAALHAPLSRAPAWRALPVLLDRAGARPQDPDTALQLAGVLVQLGLRIAAIEVIDGPALASAPRELMGDLRRVALALPDDRVEPAVRLRTCAANVEALASRGVDLRADVERWAASLEEHEWFRASDGNVVRRTRRLGAAPAWIHAADLRTPALRGELPGAWEQPGPAPSEVKPYILHGIDPPWLFQRLVRATPATINGYQPRITVVHQRTEEFLDGLSLADLSRELALERVAVVVGEHAASQLHRGLASRPGTITVGPILATPGLRTPLDPPIERVLGRVADEQSAEFERLRSLVAAMYAQRTIAWWRERFASAGAGGAPLRVLIPTSRFSSYVRHASSDLARAIEQSGHRAQILMEPDDFTRLSSVAYAQAIAEFEPDLVVLVNYTRAQIGPAMPANLPFVCWIQDAMPHLFDQKTGAAQGPLDFLAGNVSAAMLAHFHYPAQRWLASPVVASEEKFHAGPVDDARRARLACDIAYIGHQSEPPSLLRDRMLAPLPTGAPQRRLFELAYERVLALGESDAPVRWFAALADVARRTLQEITGAEPPYAAVQQLQHAFCQPVADRMLRHQTLRWASELAQERGWRLGLFGRGWASHPGLAPWACGPLEHGEDLRAAYACAGVCLHASVSTLTHQRVFECALSGGLPLCRLTGDALAGAEAWALCGPIQWAIASGAPEGTVGPFHVADHADLMMVAALRQRLTGEAQPATVAAPHHLERQLRLGQSGPSMFPIGPMLGAISEVCFSSKAGLAALVERSLGEASWRLAASGMLAGVARRSATTGAFWSALQTMIRRSLEDQAAGAAGAGASAPARASSGRQSEAPGP